MLVDLLRLDSASNNRISLYKTISWRVIGTIDTMVISYLLTSELKLAIGIGSIEVITKMALYYLHEKAWFKLIRK